MSKLQPVRGTHDILPDESRQRRFVMDVARRTAENYGYGEIATPMFEFTEVFHRTLGDTSDVVTKETYSFTDRGGENITLRPEFTASIARAFISGGMKDMLPLRFYYQGAAFRYERPQKGRLRQFHQIGTELLGVAEPQADIETIALAADILARLGLKDKVRLEINSLGDAQSRANYRTALVEYYRTHEARLSEDSKRRLERNPLRILDSKDENDRVINQSAPHLSEYLTAEAKEFFVTVTEGLASLGISFYLNDKLVRGLDYYSHTVFEFTTDALGAQNTILAGGRYDGLIATMGGADTPGIGWAAGIERLISLIDFENPPTGWEVPRRPVAIIPLGEAAEKQALPLAQQLRACGIYTEICNRGNMAKRMKKANAMHACRAVIMGDDELAAGIVTLRNLDDGTQVQKNLSDAVKELEQSTTR